jgi:hypothetical protein
MSAPGVDPRAYSRARSLAASTPGLSQGVVVVLGVVVGAVVDGTDVVVDGVWGPSFPARGIGGGDDCGTGA